MKSQPGLANHGRIVAIILLLSVSAGMLPFASGLRRYKMKMKANRYERQS